MADARAGAGQRPLPPAYETRRVRRLTGDRAGAEWGVPAETPIEINVNSRPLAVMMASPADVEDLALGFALTETVLTDPRAARGFDVQILPEGVVVDLTVDEAAVAQSRIRPRFLEGVSGCGLCGVERLADAIRDVRPADPEAAARISPEAAAAAFAALPGKQALNRATRTVHAAAFADAGGAIHTVREDVGRHNALDKLIGARARDGASMAGGFVVMSSRCSFELVQKAAIAGAGLIATVSAPTSLALALARAARLRVLCLDRGEVAEFE